MKTVIKYGIVFLGVMIFNFSALAFLEHKTKDYQITGVRVMQLGPENFVVITSKDGGEEDTVYFTDVLEAENYMISVAGRAGI